MNIKEQIKAEIVRLNDKYKHLSSVEAKHKTDCYCDLLSFINSLPDEPSENIGQLESEDLEREIDDYCRDKCHSILLNENLMSKDKTRAIARHFAQWQKGQMMKDAVDWLKAHANDYIVNCTESYPDAPFKAVIGGKCWDDLIKALED